MKHISTLILIVFLLIISSCTTPVPKEYIRLSGFAQGTTYSIIYNDSLKRNFSKEIETILQKIDTSMSVYNPQSVINAFNRSSEGMMIDTLLARVVKLSQIYCSETNGAFDITVGPLVSAWGFHAKKGEMPTDEDIQKLKRSIGNEKIKLNGHYLSKTQPGVEIDVNAVAQGFTVDVLAGFLERKGVKDYLLELGGEIRALGNSPRDDEWIVGVDKPVDDAISGEEIQVKLKITNYSLVTSGNYRKYFIKDGVKYSHTIDPQTGYPVTHTVLSTTVLDKSAARADALATAFMVLGVDATKKWLLNNPEVEVYIVYSNAEGKYEVWMSEGIKKRIVK